MTTDDPNRKTDTRPVRAFNSGTKSGSLCFPKTWFGWKSLFWLTLRRCPLCRGALLKDWPPYDDGVTVYCIPCGGLILPKGFWRALRLHSRTLERKQADTKERITQ